MSEWQDRASIDLMLDDLERWAIVPHGLSLCFGSVEPFDDRAPVDVGAGVQHHPFPVREHARFALARDHRASHARAGRKRLDGTPGASRDQCPQGVRIEVGAPHHGQARMLEEAIRDRLLRGGHDPPGDGHVVACPAGAAIVRV